jgi:hypothetical protein
MRDRLIDLLKEYSTHPEKSCPRYGTNEGCRGCNYELSDGCDYTGRRADHLLAAGVIVPKKINGYDDYSIDEYGNVYSYKSRRYVSQQKHKDGYFYVGLCKDGKRKQFAVHRLVATHFIENESGLPQVNHKDENKENNEVVNLEWCDERYNTNYGSARQRHAEKVGIAVVCIETGKVFLSQIEAGKTIDVSHRHISDCCKNKRNTCGGYHWRYASREEAERALAERGEGWKQY